MMRIPFETTGELLSTASEYDYGSGGGKREKRLMRVLASPTLRRTVADARS